MQRLTTSFPTLRRSRSLSLALALLLLAVAALRPAAPALAACGSPTVVTTEAELIDAIEDYNSQAGPCLYEIEFGADITLTNDLLSIANTNAGVELTIDGAGFTLDGDDWWAFAFEGGVGTVENILITRAFAFAVRGNNLATITVRDSRLVGNFNDGIRSDDSTLLVTGSEIIGNGDDGIEHQAFDEPPQPMWVINSTVAGNDGHGIYAYQSDFSLTNVTVAYNSVNGVYADETNAAVINNSLLTGSGDRDCATFDATVDVNFTLIGSGDDACGASDDVDGNIVGDYAGLGPLDFYGGATRTYPLLQTTGDITFASPAIDAGDNDLAVDENGDDLEFDQRGPGFPRVFVDTVDMGAHEGTLELDCALPATALDESDLNVAIICYNLITAPGVYTINLGDDILLTTETVAIDNNEAGVSLVINGNGNDIDGQDIEGTRPIFVEEDTVVTINSARLVRGNPAELTVEENGGGVFNRGDLTLNGVNVDENTTTNDGGGIFNEDGATLALVNSTVNSNRAVYPDGDGGGIINSGHITLTDSAVTGNTVEGDFGVYAGGVLNEGVMTIVRATIGNNILTADEAEAFGGGIVNQANLLIRDSTIYNNSVTAEFYLAFGGGIYSEADPEEVEDEGNGARLLIINSTISSNVASADEVVFGGGLYATDTRFGCCLEDPAPVTLVNTTLAGNFLNAANDLEFAGGGAYFELSEIDSGLAVTIHNSILADNTTDGAAGGDCVRETDAGLTFESLHSLYEDSGAGACELAAANPDGDGNIVGQDPDLGPLAPNGGPTLTHMIMGDNSDALNSGDNDLAVDEESDPLTADQRGFVPRVVNGTVDMGAVEFGAESPTPGGVFMSATVPGVTDDAVAFGFEDILQNVAGDWSIWFDGSAAGLVPSGSFKHNINAFWIPDPGAPDVVMSFTQNARIVPGIGPKVDGMDLVWWDGSTFSLWFDGNDVGLTNKTQEKIDSLHVLDGDASPIGGGCEAYLLISTQGPGKVTNYTGGTLKFGGEDVLGFCATNLGDATTGLWHMVLDGSAQGMPKNATDSISLSADGETLYLTTKGTFNVDAAAGGHSMVYAYDFGSQSFSGPLFAAPAEGLPRKVDGLQFDVTP